MNEQEKYDWMVYVSCKTYNHAPYIKDTMNGFTMQETNFPFVCAIFDDASTDGEPDVIRQYLVKNFSLDDKSVMREEETEDFIRIFAQHKENKNCFFVVVLLKYNHYSLRKNKEQYVSEWLDNTKYHAVCEGDDYWIAPQKLQKQVEIMEKNPDLSLCFCDVTNLYQSTGSFGGRQGAVFEKSHNKLPRTPKRLFYWLIMGKCRLQTLSVLYRNEFDEEPPKASFMMGDTPQWIRLSQKGPFHYINECCGVYRINEGSLSHTSSTKARFQMSMYEMRVFYCKYYHYAVPNMVKQNYNRCLCRVWRLNGTDYKAKYPLFEMNVLQRLVARNYLKGNGLANRIAVFLWNIETHIANFRIRYSLYSELR